MHQDRDAPLIAPLPASHELRAIDIPHVRVSLEVRTLRSNHAEALPRRRFHDPPTLYVSDTPRAKLFEPTYFGLYVVGLDVDVNAAGMLDRLY